MLHVDATYLSLLAHFNALPSMSHCCVNTSLTCAEVQRLVHTEPIPAGMPRCAVLCYVVLCYGVLRYSNACACVVRVKSVLWSGRLCLELMGSHDSVAVDRCRHSGSWELR